MLEMRRICEHTLGWHRAFPKRVKPNLIYITCDVHMMVQNWFVMPDLSESITAATKAGLALVVPLCEQILHAGTWWLQLLWLVLLLQRPKANFQCHCPHSFHKLLVKLFQFASGGLENWRVISLFFERTFLNTYLIVAMLDMSWLCLWGQQKWESQWDYISLMKLLWLMFNFMKFN